MGNNDDFYSQNDLTVSYADRIVSWFSTILNSSILIPVVYIIQIIVGIELSILSQDRVIWAFGLKVTLDILFLVLDFLLIKESQHKKWLKVAALLSTVSTTIIVGVYYLYYGYGYFGITHSCAEACNSLYPESTICVNTSNCTVAEFNSFINQQNTFDYNTWYCMGFLATEVILMHLQTGDVVGFISLGHFS